MKIAAIDIGSNAIRFQVTNILQHEGSPVFKKVEYVRFPLRLGEDVFKTKMIGPVKEEKFMKLMQAYKLLIDLYELDDYMVCATSAMRESKNGHEIADRVKEKLGMKIQIIDGNKEAELINSVIFSSIDEKPYLHIDVGGGSTELNIYVNREKVFAKSFKIGSVRKLDGAESPQVWKRMEEWVREHTGKTAESVTAIGTGGNINKIYELSTIKEAKALPIKHFELVREQILAMSFEERMAVLMLNADRADVIIPASDIYLSVMRWAGARQIMVPSVGLKDGMIQTLYRKLVKRKKV